MAKFDDVILSIFDLVPDGAGKSEILCLLKKELGEQTPSERTLRRYLLRLVQEGKILSSGKGRATKYMDAKRLRSSATGTAIVKADLLVESYVPMSDEAREVREYLRQPIQKRIPVGYQREFLELYEPNQTEYLTADIKAHLFKIGKTGEQEQVAGTYAREILNRLLIDLSWASSSLEGNTYTILDTQNLIEAGKVAIGKDHMETVMILNHKRAIELLIENASEIDFNSYTFLNLHGILSDGLLGDPTDSGRVRDRIVDISGTVYRPLSIPQQLQQHFVSILEKAKVIHDPFEQSFFIMVHIPYLQPFSDVNKRVSRIGANLSLIKRNLCPLSFIEVPEKAYIEGTLGVYELNNISLLRDVFVWAYERSCQQYNAIQNSGVEPEPFRLKYRKELYATVEKIVKQEIEYEVKTIIQVTEGQVSKKDMGHFIELLKAELKNLHQGNLSRYRLRLSDFTRWQDSRS